MVSSKLFWHPCLLTYKSNTRMHFEIKTCMFRPPIVGYYGEDHKQSSYSTEQLFCACFKSERKSSLGFTEYIIKDTTAAFWDTLRYLAHRYEFSRVKSNSRRLDRISKISILIFRLTAIGVQVHSASKFSSLSICLVSISNWISLLNHDSDQ